jgi:hypothetical protein
MSRQYALARIMARSKTTPAAINLEVIMQHSRNLTPVRDVSLIRRGNWIEAYRGGQTCYRGDVTETAPGLGIIWIREDGRHGRRAVSLDDFTVLRSPRQSAGFQGQDHL